MGPNDDDEMKTKATHWWQKTPDAHNLLYNDSQNILGHVSW